jgi:hypothetical protein
LRCIPVSFRLQQWRLSLSIPSWSIGLNSIYFVLIPIIMSISIIYSRIDWLVGIYHNFFVIVGALFAYKTLFKSPEHSGIQEALKEGKKPLTWRSTGRTVGITLR